MDVSVHQDTNVGHLHRRRVTLAALFHVLCVPNKLTNYTRCMTLNVPILINFKFQSMSNCFLCTDACRLNSGNACYHSVYSLLSSRLLSRNVKVKLYKT
jgi:hypothetical protein